MLNYLESRRADRCNSFLFSFTADMDDFAEEVDVIEVQGDKLADTHSSAVKGFHHGPVSYAEPIVERRGLEESLDLLVFEKTWKSLFLPGCADGCNRVVGSVISPEEELVETAEGGELSGDGGLGVTLFVEEGEIGPDIVGAGGDEHFSGFHL